mmetsp:Transcript_5301/g.16731  ORF Transcript_5301/g.16731 Transcript_5301/m.16731 type:complete len:247 (-) Transcript_5301:100-840(-)
MVEVTSPATLATFFASSTSWPDSALFDTSSSAAAEALRASSLSAEAVVADAAARSRTPGVLVHASTACEMALGASSLDAASAKRTGSDKTSAVSCADRVIELTSVFRARSKTALPAAVPASSATWLASPTSFLVAGSLRNSSVTLTAATVAAVVSLTAFSSAAAKSASVFWSTMGLRGSGWYVFAARASPTPPRSAAAPAEKQSPLLFASIITGGVFCGASEAARPAHRRTRTMAFRRSCPIAEKR